MTTLNPHDIGVVAYQAGWRGKDLVIAIAVALAESGGRTDAVNTANSNGTTDYGLFQVNSIHNPTAEERTQALPNARKAKSIWDARAKTDSSGWNAWSVYNSRRYLFFIPQATPAAAAVEGEAKLGKIPDIAGDIAGGVTGGIGNIAGQAQDLIKILKTLGDPYTWKRIAFFGMGVVIGIIGLVMVLRSTGPVKAAESAAKSVVKTAAKAKVL